MLVRASSLHLLPLPVPRQPPQATPSVQTAAASPSTSPLTSPPYAIRSSHIVATHFRPAPCEATSAAFQRLSSRQTEHCHTSSAAATSKARQQMHGVHQHQHQHHGRVAACEQAGNTGKRAAAYMYMHVVKWFAKSSSRPVRRGRRPRPTPAAGGRVRTAQPPAGARLPSARQVHHRVVPRNFRVSAFSSLRWPTSAGQAHGDPGRHVGCAPWRTRGVGHGWEV